MQATSLLGALPEPMFRDEDLGVAMWFWPDARVSALSLTRELVIGHEYSRWSLEELFPLIRRYIPEGEIRSLNDWRFASSYTSEARSELTEFTLGRRKEFETLRIAAGATNAGMRVGLSTAKLALRVVGLDFRVVDDPLDSLREWGISFRSP